MDKAYEWLETAYAQRDPGISNLATDLLLIPLRGDRRWSPLMKKLGFA